MKQVLLANDETSTSITQIAVTTLKEGEYISIHIHKTMEEYFLFLKGSGSLKAIDEEIKCYEGMFILVPAGIPHSLRANSELKFITIGVALVQKA